MLGVKSSSSNSCKNRKSYVKPQVQEGILLDCSLGTNPYGFPKQILKKINEYKDLSLYPDPYHSLLRDALVDYWDGLFNSSQVFICSGSMGCLEKINKALLSRGVKVLGYAPQFQEYISEVKSVGGIYEYVSLKEKTRFKFILNDILDNLQSKYALVYIDNPNNPTGQVIPLDAIEDIIVKAMKKDIVVIVDEAYGEFMKRDNSAITLDYPNLIVTRSFSKGFGLANLRVGYVVIKGTRLNRVYSKVNLPFQISGLSETLAIEALGYFDHVEQSTHKIHLNKRKLMNFLKKMGYGISATSMNVPIMLVWKHGLDLYQYLLKKGILTVNGEDFTNLTSEFVRIRLPSDIGSFKKLIMDH